MGRKWPGMGSPNSTALLLMCLLTVAASAAGGQAAARAEQPRSAVAVEALPDAPGFDSTGPAAMPVRLQTQKPAAADAPMAGGQVNGSVIDRDAVVLADADVTLSVEGSTAVRRSKTDIAGRYHFGGVLAGKFRVTASMTGMIPGSFANRLSEGEIFEVPGIKLTLAAVHLDVDVMATEEDLAEAEIHVEEHQRLAGFMPNFFVTYDWNAAPLTTRQKFELAWKNSIDPGNFVVSAGVAGVQQAENAFPGYGQGAAGYGKRLGAATGDLLFGTMLGGAIFPTIFHQDPRYFYKGTGTVKSRLLYAVSRAVVCRGDNGKSQPAYASILGDLAAGAVTNLYYPAANREGAALTFEEGILNVGGDALGNVVQEFVFRHVTPHAPSYDTQRP